MCEINGVPHYLNNNGNAQRHQANQNQPNCGGSKTDGGGRGDRRNVRKYPGTTNYHHHHPTHNGVSKKVNTFPQADRADPEEFELYPIFKGNPKEFIPNGQHVLSDLHLHSHNSSLPNVTTQSIINADLVTSPVPTTSHFNHANFQTASKFVPDISPLR